MNYKALFLDIDGTILQHDNTYTPSTKEAIAQLKEKGIEVFIATGRPIHEVKGLGEELNIQSYIGYNGAHAIYKNETIIDEPMKKEHVKKFIEIAKENNHEMVLYTNANNYFTSMDDPHMKRFMKTFQLTKNHMLTEDVMDKIIGISITNIDPSQYPQYEIDESIVLTQVVVGGNEDACDVLRTSVNKGEAIKKVLPKLNISKEQAIAFGDGLNDKEMLQEVGESFAMGNAHPDLFKIAKHKTTTVSESGIYNGLKSLGLVK
jgi:Cof subfamily protein (haloacid dehalogenase superfamily)